MTSVLENLFCLLVEVSDMSESNRSGIMKLNLRSALNAASFMYDKEQGLSLFNFSQ